MRQLKRWRYYCDFCRKAGGSKRHMETHETHCTLNPNRLCRVHSVIMFDQECQPTTAELLDAFKVGFGKLKEVAHNCPACILSAMRQTPCDKFPELLNDNGYRKVPKEDDWSEWDYKAEMGSLMKEFHSERASEFRAMVGPVW